jgi:hypothetical protein
MKLTLLFVSAFLLMAPCVGMGDVIVAGGTGLSFITNVDGHSVDTVETFSIRGGYRFPQVDLYLEFNGYTVSDGNSTLYVSREHQEWIMWSRHIFHPEWVVAPYVSAGAGFQYDTIQTNLNTDNSNEQGSAQALGVLGGGVRITIWQQLDLQIEARASYSADNVPDPTVGCGFLFGWSF